MSGSDKPGGTAMEGREGGFIVLHRRIESSPLWRSMTAEQRAVFLTLLLMANWKPERAVWRRQWYEVRRGELSHTLAHIAKRAATGVKVVRNTLALLMADDKAAGGNGPAIIERYPIQGTGPGTGPRLLTIVNYEKYQDVPDLTGTAKGTGGARGVGSIYEAVSEIFEKKGTAKGTGSGVANSGNQLPFGGVDDRAGTAKGTGRARVGHGSGTGGAQREQVEQVEPVLPSDEPAARAKGSDPRKGEKRAAFERVFREVRGTDYYWQGPKDWQAVGRLVAVPLPEWEARSRLGLQSTDYARRIDSVAQLGMKWNALAGATPQQRVIGGAGNWNDPESLKW